jgi:flagellin
MALGVLNNLSAIYAENNLNNTQSSLQTVLQQLSSGSKINSGADDAAGLSLVNGLQANSAALTQSETNTTEGVGLLQVADGALSQVTSLLDRAITLATEASNGTLNSTQESAADQEYQSIMGEVNNIGSTTTYNQQTVFSGQTISIYTGDSSTTGSSIDNLNIRTLSAASVGDTDGAMSYSDGKNNVFLNLSSSTTNAQLTDVLNPAGATTIDVNYLVPGGAGASSTASTQITVGTGTSYGNTVSGLISAINNAGLGLTASFATQAQAGVTGAGTQTGIQISGGLVSAGVDPTSASTGGTLNPDGIPASELLTQGQTVTVEVGGVTAASVDTTTYNTLQELAAQINAHSNGTAGLATASVVTNGDGTQSLALASTAGSGVLSVTATGGSAPAAPFFSNLGTAANASVANISTLSSPVTGTKQIAAVYGSLTLGVANNPNSVDSASDKVSGSIVITDGTLPPQTFIMGGTNPTTAPNNSITTTTVQGNSLSALASAIAAQLSANGDTGASATVGATGLVITSGTAGNTIAAPSATNQLFNTNAKLDLYTPGDPGSGTVYATGLVALVNPNGTAITGTITPGSDTLVGSVTLTNNGVTDTFMMGNAPTGPTGLSLNGVAPKPAGGNIIYTGGTTIGSLETAITGDNALTGDSLKLTATSDPTSGGFYLQSSAPGTTITVSSSLSDGYLENNPTTVNGVSPVGGSASSVLVGSGGAVNTTDVLQGAITLTNVVDASGVNGASIAHTFTMGTSAYDPSKPAVSGTVPNLTVNGDTLADLARAIGADTSLGLSGLASTAGLALTSNSNSGAAIGVSSTLTDTTAGTDSVVTLGSFAGENDTVSGTLNYYVGSTPVKITLPADATVASMIQQLNDPANNSGVTATWVPGSNGAGSVLLTSNAAGSSGQISATSGSKVLPVSTITDTAVTATLSYTPATPYNTGLSSDVKNVVYDSTAGQGSTAATQATFVSDIRSGSGAAETSYADDAGQSLSGTSLLSQSSAESALGDLNTAVSDIASMDGYIGAQINTLNSISQVMSTQQENLTSAQNAIQATDYASATANMSKYEILSQTGIAALAQANTVQQEVTKLLQ